MRTPNLRRALFAIGLLGSISATRVAWADISPPAPPPRGAIAEDLPPPGPPSMSVARRAGPAALLVAFGVGLGALGVGVAVRRRGA